MKWRLCGDPGTHCGDYSQWRSANKRGSTSVRSRSWSLRDSAITRRNACCSIAWKILRRPWIFLRVGQQSKTTVDPRGKTIVCKTNNFVPLVVPRLSANSGGHSSATSTLHETGEGHLKKPKPKQKEGWQSRFGRPFARSSRSACTRTHFSWLRFGTSYESGIKIKQKHNIYSHIPKDPNCEFCLRTKMTRVPCTRRAGEALHWAAKFGDLTTADHRVLIEEGDSPNNHRCAVVIQDLATQRIQSHPCKNKDFSGDGKEFTKVLGAVTQAKSHLHWQFLGIWQILWRSIMESSNFNTSSIRNEWHCWKSRTKSERRNFNSIATLRIGWKVVGWFCGMLRNIQDLLSDGKTHKKDGLENHSKGTKFLFWSNGWISPYFSARSIKTSSILQESFIRNLSWVWTDRGENLERWHSDCGHWRIGKYGRIGNLSSKKQRELQGEPGEPQPTESTDDAEARAEVDSRWLHLSSAQWTSISTLCAKGRNILYSTEIHWRTDLAVMQEKRTDDYWNVDSNGTLSGTWKGFTKITPVKEKPLKGFLWSGERLTKVQTTTRPDHVWPEVWTNIGRSRSESRKKEWKNEKPQLDNARRLRGIYFIDPDDQDYKETLKHARRKLERPLDAAMLCKKGFILAPGNWEWSWMHLTKSQRQTMVVSWNLMSPQGNEWNLLNQKIHEDHIAGKRIYFDDTLQFGAQVSFRCLERCKFRMPKQQWTRNGRSSRQSQPGSWKKWRAKRRLFSKHKETKSESTLLHWWTYVTSRTRI